MDIIIDIQGFVGPQDGEFMPKEIALLSMDASYVGHWIIQPPVPYNDLPEDVRRLNCWLTQCLHGIEWFEGETNARKWRNLIRDITYAAGRIFVCGRNKALYLKSIVSREVYDLEVYTMSSSFNNPESMNFFSKCFLHATRKPQDSICALNKAHKLRSFLMGSKSPLDTIFRKSNNSSPTSSNLDPVKYLYFSGCDLKAKSNARYNAQTTSEMFNCVESPRAGGNCMETSVNSAEKIQPVDLGRRC